MSDRTVAIAPHPVYVGKLALVLAVGFAIVALFSGGFDVGTVVVFVAMVIFLWWFLRLKLSPEGMSVGVNKAPWAKLDVRPGKRGDVILSVDAQSWRERLVFSPVNYEDDWRAGRIGDAVRRWRPDLLDDH